MKYDNPVIVLGMNFPAIDIMQYFEKIVDEVIGLDFHRDNIGFMTKKGKKMVCPNPTIDANGFIDFMLGIKFQSPNKPVLFNTSDNYVEVIQKYKSRLKERYLFHEMDYSTIRRVNSKKGQYELSVEYDLHAPRTILYKENNDINKISYPCIIKPLFAPSWRTEEYREIIKGQKVICINNEDELRNCVSMLTSRGNEFLIQEIIPGPDENLIYLVFLMSKDHELLAYFGGAKLRNIPIHYGSASFVQTLSDYQYLPITKLQHFLRNIKITGPVGIELKKDMDSGEYKLVEINPRFGLWDRLGAKVGVDLFKLAYRDLVGDSVNTTYPQKKAYYWIALSRDILAFRGYRKERTINFWSWITSIKVKNTIYEDIQITEIKLMYHIFIRTTWLKMKRKIKGELFN